MDYGMKHGNDTLKLLRKLEEHTDNLDCSYLDITSLPERCAQGLRILCLSDTQITQLPELFEGLEELDLAYCEGVDSLPRLPSTLTKLDCRYTSVVKLPELPEGLKVLICTNTKIVSLPKLPTSLKILRCSHSPLISLPILGPNLTWISVNGTMIRDLPLLPASLVKLYLSDTNVSVLSSPLPLTLDCLDCSRTLVNRLPELPDSLQSLLIMNTGVVSLPNIPVELQMIGCSSEVLENSFSFLPQSLQFILCSDFDCFKCLYWTVTNGKSSYHAFFKEWLDGRSKGRVVGRTAFIKSELLGFIKNNDSVS